MKSRRLIGLLFFVSTLSLFLPSLTVAQKGQKGDGTIVQRIDVSTGIVIPLRTKFFVTEEQVKKVLPIQEGDRLDQEKLDQTLSYLKKWGRFSQVSIEKSLVQNGVILLITVQQGLMISNINIDGTYPFLENRLRRTLSIHPGEIYIPEEMLPQIEKLKSFYERRGFHNLGIDLETHINPEKGTINLNFSIHKGYRYRFQEVEVQGNTVFPHSYFVSQLNPLLAYEPSRFRQKIDNIKADYLHKGYLSARVRILDLQINPETKTLHPILEVSEGKKVAVSFHGNSRISHRTLKSVMPMFNEGGYNIYDIEISAKAILDYYHKLGFLEAEVKYEKKEISEKKLLITFTIHEGPQTRVKKINLTGLEKISQRRIRKELITKENTIVESGYFQPRTVEQDAKNLPQILQNKGAYEGKLLKQETILNPLKDKATVNFQFEEGPLLHLTQVVFEGLHRFKEKEITSQMKLRPGAVLTQNKLSADLQKITLLYANVGYPYTTLTHELIRKDQEATLLIKVDEGVEVRIGEILFVGNERSLEKAILQSILLKKGDLFSYQKILESERNLRRTGSYRSAGIETIGLTEHAPIVHLLVKVEEFKKLLIDLGVAYNTDTQFTGTLSLSHVNLFGTNKRASLNLTGGQEIQKVEGLLRDPHFLGFPIVGTLSAKTERQERPGFTTVDSGTSVSVLKEFTTRLSLLGRYELLRTFFSNVVDSTGAQEEDHTTSKFSFSMGYDKRDSFSDPRTGYILLGGFDVSNKLIASSFNYIQPRGYFAHFLPLGGPFTLMTFYRIEGIQNLGSNELTRDRKLFLGGDYSIRGFDEDSVGPLETDGTPLGGQLLFTNTVELQTRLVKDFKFALFFDNGSLTEDISDVSLDTFRQSAGFGLRYVTPVGPLRLDYGIKLDRRPEESFGRLHFAFGYSF